MTPVRYKISNWTQLPGCLSASSTHLHITVSKIVNDTLLHGILISVIDDRYGVVFACMPEVSGSMVFEDSPLCEELKPLTTEQILEQLAIFGFFVEYHPVQYLPTSQLVYLATINNLSFDKLTVLTVVSKDHKREVVTGFNTEKHGDWLTFGTDVPEHVYKDALNDGSAINLSAISFNIGIDWTWDWLTYVASIEDILNEQRSDEE